MCTFLSTKQLNHNDTQQWAEGLSVTIMISFYHHKTEVMDVLSIYKTKMCSYNNLVTKSIKAHLLLVFQL